MTQQQAQAPGWGRSMSREETPGRDEDEVLITRFLKGDTAAFDTLFARRQEFVYNTIYGLLGNAEEARDLTQEVFVQVYHSLPGFRCDSKFSTWLYRIAVNRALDSARAARRHPGLPLLDRVISLFRTTPDTPSPQEIAEEHEQQAAVQRILMRCPLSHRKTLVLRYYDGLSLLEMASVLGCSEATAKVRLYRARLVFRRLYAEAYGNSDAGMLPAEKEAADAPGISNR